jgi:hypothetical protein
VDARWLDKLNAATTGFWQVAVLAVVSRIKMKATNETAEYNVHNVGAIVFNNCQ